MALRKAAAYSKKHVTPYTRISKRKGKAFIKTVPPQKIVKFSMGNEQGFREKKMPFHITMSTTERIQIRHNALEACRQYLNRKLDKELTGSSYFRVIPFPHHIQRENKMITGAGADRMQTGMQLSFGKSAGKAAILNEGDGIFFVAVQNEKDSKQARIWLSQIRSKLPCKTKISLEIVK